MNAGPLWTRGVAVLPPRRPSAVFLCCTAEKDQQRDDRCDDGRLTLTTILTDGKVVDSETLSHTMNQFATLRWKGASILNAPIGLRSIRVADIGVIPS